MSDPYEHAIEAIRDASADLVNQVMGKGRPKSLRHRQKLSKALKGRTLSREHRQKISDGIRKAHAYDLPRQFSEEHRRKLREARARRPKASWATRAKQRKAALGRTHSDATKEKIRKARLARTGGPKRDRQISNQRASESMKAVWVLRKAEAKHGGKIPAWLEDDPDIRAAREALVKKSRPGDFAAKLPTGEKPLSTPRARGFGLPDRY